jgi:hypothetical protein
MDPLPSADAAAPKTNPSAMEHTSGSDLMMSCDSECRNTLPGDLTI